MQGGEASLASLNEVDSRLWTSRVDMDTFMEFSKLL